MTDFRFPKLILALWTTVACNGGPSQDNGVQLDSWNTGPARSAIEDFVASVTTPGSSGFVRAEERIAVFDNDGTLWAEQPFYFQLRFALDRVPTLVDERPALREHPLVRAILDGDQDRIAAMDHHELAELIGATHGERTIDEFQDAVRSWLRSARHPRFDRRYDELIYQPMRELLDYLDAHGFKVFIVSGGGIDFIRVFAEEVYGIPPDRVIGSSLTARFDGRDANAVIVKGTDIASVNDKAVKPVNINLHIGRRPILAFGNSDGDLQMLQYTDSGTGTRLSLILRHDDPDREWQYDRESPVGRLDEALDVAEERGWVVVSMRDDFRSVFAFDGH